MGGRVSVLRLQPACPSLRRACKRHRSAPQLLRHMDCKPAPPAGCGQRRQGLHHCRPPPLACIPRRFEVEEVQGGCRLALKRTLISKLPPKER